MVRCTQLYGFVFHFYGDTFIYQLYSYVYMCLLAVLLGMVDSHFVRNFFQNKYGIFDLTTTMWTADGVESHTNWPTLDRHYDVILRWHIGKMLDLFYTHTGHHGKYYYDSRVEAKNKIYIHIYKWVWHIACNAACNYATRKMNVYFLLTNEQQK